MSNTLMSNTLLKSCFTVLALVAGALWCRADVPLPSDYTALDWIQSSGTQYINTDYTPSVDSRIEASLNTLRRTGDWTMFFGVTSGNANKELIEGIGFRYMKSTSLAAYFCTESSIDVQPVADMTDTDVTVVLAKDTLIVNGVSTPITTTGTPYQSPLYLFCSDKGGTPWRHQAMRLYSFKIQENGEPKRDFVPCRNPSGEAGLWDKVEGRFYENRGDGRFIGSDEPAEMRFNWIQSSGTQHIDTGIPASITLQAEADVVFNAYEGGVNFGHMDDDGADWRLFNYSKGMYFDCGSARVTAGTLTLGTRYLLEFGVNEAEKVFAKATYQATGGEATKKEVALSGDPLPSNVKALGGSMRLYSFKITDGGKVVRDFVPYRKNGEVGLLDLQSGNFFANAGTGTFATGPFAYTMDGTRLLVYEGALEQQLIPAGTTEIAAAGWWSDIDATALTEYPALTIEKATLSLQDGAATAYSVTGALTLKGGARLKIDVAANGCDSIAAGSVVLDSSLTAATPATIKVNAVGVAELSGPIALIAGGSLTAADAAKFVVDGFPAEVRVINGDLMLAPKSAGTFTWTGGAGDGKWSSADNWQDHEVPSAGAVVVFGTEGAATTCDISGLSLKAVVFEEGAGSFSVGGNALAVLSAITNLSASAQTFTGSLALGVGKTFDVMCAGEVNLHGSGSLAGDLVKGGNGTLRIDDVIVCSGRNLTATAGKIVPNHTGWVASAANPGEIRIADGAQLDVDLNHSDRTNLKETEVTHGKTVFVAGDGPDGNGALYNSQIASGWGATFGHIVLAGDASVGGGRMDLRSLADSAVAPGEGSARLEGGYALTALGSWFNCRNVTHAIKQVNVQGKFGLELGVDGTVTNGVHLADGSELELSAANIGAGIPIVVDANANITTSGSSAGTMNSALTVNEGAALSMQLDKDLVVNGPITNNGSIVKTGGSSLVVNGGMIGGGNVEWKAGWLDLVNEFDPTATLKVSGGNVHFGHGGTTGAPASAPVLSAPYAGGDVSFWFGTETTLGNGYDDFLEQVAAAKQKVRICETSPTANLILKGANWTVYDFYPGNQTDYGFLTIDEGSTVTVTHGIRMGNEGKSPKSTRIEVKEGGVLDVKATEFRIGYYSGPTGTETHQLVVNGGTVNDTAGSVQIGYDSPNAYVTLNAGRLAATGIRNRDCINETEFYHGELFRQFGGALELGGDGFYTCLNNRSGHPYADLAGGTFKAAANMGTTVGLFTAAFGETVAGAYELDLNGKAVTWSTALQGLSDVTLKGEGGSFTTMADFQGVPKGLWTVEPGVAADLSGAAGFAGGIALNAGAAATVSIGGTRAVEMAVFSCDTKADSFADANAVVAFDGPYPYRATTFSRLHATRKTGDIQNVHFAYRGQFYVPEQKTYFFAGTYDDDLTLAIDGETVLTSLGVTDSWKTVVTGSRELAAGWHDFIVVAHDKTGGQGPVSDAGHGWANSKMALGWTDDSTRQGSLEAADYNRFDTTTLAMRVKPENEVCVLWGRKAGYETLEDDPFVDAANGVLHSLKFLRTADNDVVNMLCKGNKCARLTGSFYAETTGEYEFSAVFDDIIVLYIDGQKIVRNPKYNQRETVKVTLAAGWHGFDIRVSDNSGGVGAANALTVKKPGADAAVPFDEEALAMTAPTGLGGTTTLGAGATLANAADGACPIYGRLAGEGALAGKFAFTEGGVLCVTAAKNGIASAPDLSGVTNEDLFADLKTIDLTLVERVYPSRLVLGPAGSLTAAEAAEIAVRVTKPDDLKVGVWRATVANGKFVLVNPNPAGLIICIQ